jgi:hypothetical protein
MEEHEIILLAARIAELLRPLSDDDRLEVVSSVAVLLSLWGATILPTHANVGMTNET